MIVISSRRFLPTVTSVMYHPTPELRARWLKQYGKDRFTFEEALEAQSFPKNWLFPTQNYKKWKWLGEAFPPKVAEYLFNRYIREDNLVLLDLFAGIGGWSLGAYWSGKFRKVIMVEKDKEKCLYLNMNFKNLGIDFEIVCSDVRDVCFEELEPVDVVVASPPCEDLSVLRFFRPNPTSKGTVPLTLFTVNLVEKIRPKVAFYENVYRRPLREIMERYGWICMRFDMSRIIPQKRVRLICIYKSAKAQWL